MTVHTSSQSARAAATVVADVTYQGRRIVVSSVPAYQAERSSQAAHLELAIDGRSYQCPKGDAATVLKKVKANIDIDGENAHLLTDLQALIKNAELSDKLIVLDGPVEGDVAYVFAMGKLRRGLVTKVTKTRVEVAYTTASNPTRVFRKATAQDGLQTDAPTERRETVVVGVNGAENYAPGEQRDAEARETEASYQAEQEAAYRAQLDAAREARTAALEALLGNDVVELLNVLSDAVDDACYYRSGEDSECGDCEELQEDDPAALCTDHTEDNEKAEGYIAAFRSLRTLLSR